MELPSSPECEQALLSSILQDSSIASKIAIPDIFYVPANLLLFGIIRSSGFNTRGCSYPILISSISESDLQEIGGKDHIACLYNYVPSPDNWNNYYEILLDYYDKRRAIRVANDIASLCKERGSEFDDVLKLATGIKRSVPAESNVSTGKSLASELNEWMEKIQNGELQDRGIMWCFQGLPNLIDKLRPGELCLIGGRPGSGKTSLANSVVSLSCIPQNKSCLVFSLEMGLKEETLRIISILGRIPLLRLKNQSLMTDKDFQKYSESMIKLANSKLAISSEILNIHEIYNQARGYKELYGLDLVVIDHVQLVKYKDSDVMERREALDECGRICKYMSKDLDCVVMLLTQINREDASPFECSSLEAHADQYIIVPNSDSDVTTKELRVRKNRNGPVGLVECRWFPDCASFY